MEKMSKEQERRLLSALDKAAGASRSGENPDAILTKVALEYKLTAPEICRVAEAYNKAKSVAFCKSASADDRSSDFPIAHSEKILESVFKPVEKTASLHFPIRNYSDLARVNMMGKTASETPKTAQERVTTRRSSMSVWNEATNFFDLQKKVHGLLKNAYRQAEVKAQSAIAKIASSIEMTPKAELSKIARNIVNAYGPDRGNVFINYLNGRMRFHKLPSDMEKTASAVVFPCREPYLSLARVADVCHCRDKARKDLEFFEKNSKEMTVEELFKSVPGMIPDVAGGSGIDFLDFQTAMPGVWNEYLKSLAPKSMLYNIYLSDDELRSYPWEDVQSGFNMILQTTPQLSDNPLWMKSTLKRLLAQGGRMDPFEIRDLLTAEGTKVDAAKKFSEIVGEVAGKGGKGRSDGEQPRGGSSITNLTIPKIVVS